ncbi:MAG: hypothetical protein ACXW5U_20780 [Thermoanaerobaculia bacterium]
MKRKVLMFMLVAVAIPCAYAQQPDCKQGETMQDCFVRFGPEWARMTDSMSLAQTEVMKTNTGITTIESPSQSAVKDFLSPFLAALIMPMSGDGSMPLALDFNVPLGTLGDKHLKLEAVFVRPELGGDLEQRLANNAAAMTAVKDTLSEFDDVTVSGSLDRSSRGMGRRMTPHRDDYVKLLDARFRTKKERLSLNDADDVRSAADALIGEFAGQFALLLSNQPQLYGSVIYRARKSVAGPTERAARVTYEMGGHNLNRFYREHADCLSPADAVVDDCAEKLAAFAGAPENDPGHRLAISAEYRTSDAFRVTLPDYTVDFKASSAHSLVYSLAYGRKNVMKKGRLDVAVHYEDTTVSEVTDLIPTEAVVESRKAVRDRLVASATYTYKVNDQMAVPLSLVYANHSEHLGDVDRRLNAHIGITFKMR